MDLRLEASFQLPTFEEGSTTTLLLVVIEFPWSAVTPR